MSLVGSEAKARLREILFVELLGGLGDTLISLSTIQALARSHSEARLTVLTFHPGGDLLLRDPLIHEVIQTPKPDATNPHRAREAVKTTLAARDWDLVVSDTSYDGIEGIISSSGAPRCVTNLWRSPPPDERVGERFLRLLISDGLISPDTIAPPRLRLTPKERSTAAEKLTSLGLSMDRPLAFLIPDAGMEVKRWPEERWVSLSRTLRARHGASVVAPAGSDPESAARLARPARATLWPPGTLRELAAALSWASLAIGADTGPARITAALDVPTITLFGPSWHGRYGQPHPHPNLQGHPECPQRVVSDFTQQPCWYHGACTLENPPWTSCLEDITVESVLDASAPFLDQVRKETM